MNFPIQDKANPTSGSKSLPIDLSFQAYCRLLVIYIIVRMYKKYAVGVIDLLDQNYLRNEVGGEVGRGTRD